MKLCKSCDRSSKRCELPGDTPPHLLRNHELTQGSENKNFETLSSLGHYLKGSSATLGLTKVKDSCEKIQHLGAHKDETGDKEGYEDVETLKKISDNVKVAKVEYKVAEKLLRRFFGEPEES